MLTPYFSYEQLHITYWLNPPVIMSMNVFVYTPLLHADL